MQSKQSRWQHRGSRAAVAALALTLLGTLAAACTSSPSGRTVASLPGGPAAAGVAGAGTSTTSSDQNIVDYTHCLRAHGVNEPDPRDETHNGKTGLSFVLPPSNQANQAALSACNHFITSLMAAKQSGANHELASWLPSLVRYASCMRHHDVPMLDPGPQGQLNLGSVPGTTSDFGRYSSQFRSADAACRHLLPAAVHDDGTGP
jgi:hypothetical protein